MKLDHHINVEPYGDLMWVEEERSSACEMVADFYDKCRDELTLTKDAALYLYTGMVTDSGRFRFSCVSGDTMRLAAMLLDTGIDTEWLFANLYSVEFNSLKFKAYVYENMHRTENGVAYFSVSKDVQTQFGLSYEQASAAISYLEGIRGYLCWLAFQQLVLVFLCQHRPVLQSCKHIGIQYIIADIVHLLLYVVD